MPSIPQLKAELAEQQRLNGAGSEREAALHSKIALLERKLERLVWSLDNIHWQASRKTVWANVGRRLDVCAEEARQALEAYARDVAANSGSNHRMISSGKKADQNTTSNSKSSRAGTKPHGGSQLDGAEIPIGRGDVA